MTCHRIDAILLASGFARRFGGGKLLAPVGGVPMGRHALALAAGMGCFDRVFFVAADDETAALAEGFPAEVIRNAAPEKGRRESIRLGTAASEADFYLFLPCDQPFLDASVVRAVLERRAPGAIVRPTYKGEPGSPVLFSKAFREELLTLGPGESGKTIIARRPDRLIDAPIPPRPGPSPLADVDTWEDYLGVARGNGNGGMGNGERGDMRTCGSCPACET